MAEAIASSLTCSSNRDDGVNDVSRQINSGRKLIPLQTDREFIAILVVVLKSFTNNVYKHFSRTAVTFFDRVQRTVEIGGHDGRKKGGVSAIFA